MLYDPSHLARALGAASDQIAAPARAIARISEQITVPMRAAFDACRVNPPSLHIPEKLSK